jgi:hypothetical protein
VDRYLLVSKNQKESDRAFEKKADNDKSKYINIIKEGKEVEKAVFSPEQNTSPLWDKMKRQFSIEFNKKDEVL